MDYPIHFAEQVSQHLKAFRKQRGLTQVQLAMRLGVSQSRVADIEAHPGKVSLESLIKILAALDVRVLLRDAPAQHIEFEKQTKPKTLAELKLADVKRTSDREDW